MPYVGLYFLHSQRAAVLPTTQCRTASDEAQTLSVATQAGAKCAEGDAPAGIVRQAGRLFRRVCIVESRCITVGILWQISPAVFYEVVLLLQVARIERMGDGAKFLAYKGALTAYGITVADRFGRVKVEFCLSGPFFSVAGSHFYGMLYVILAEKHAQAFSPDCTVLYAKSNFHILCISCGS